MPSSWRRATGSSCTWRSTTPANTPRPAPRQPHAVADRSGYTAAQVDTHLRVRTGTDAAAHLFSVASGLDSMVVGEREIQGQVRRALTAARRDGTTTSGLESLFQAASRVSRLVESRTGLGATGRSVVGVALDIAEQRAARLVRGPLRAHRHRLLRRCVAGRAQGPRRR